MGGSPTRNMERQLNLFGYLFEKERKTYQLTGEELSDVLVFLYFHWSKINMLCLFSYLLSAQNLLSPWQRKRKRENTYPHQKTRKIHPPNARNIEEVL